MRVHFPVRLELGCQLFLQHAQLAQVLVRSKIQHQRADLGTQEVVGTTGTHRGQPVQVFGIDKLQYAVVIGEMADHVLFR